MRLAPVPLFYFLDKPTAIHYAGESSRTTQGAAECVEACRLLADILVRDLAGETKEKLLCLPEDDVRRPPLELQCDKIIAIARGDFLEKPLDRIQSMAEELLHRSKNRTRPVPKG